MVFCCCCCYLCYRLGVMYYNLQFKISEVHCGEALSWIVYITSFDVGLNYNDKYLQQIQWPHTMIRHRSKGLCYVSHLFYYFYSNEKRKWHQNFVWISICEQNIYCHCSHSPLLKWRQWHQNSMFVVTFDWGNSSLMRAISMAQWRKEIIHILWFLHKWA